MATFTPRPITSKAKLILAGSAALFIAACDANGNFDIDLRDLGGGGLDTTALVTVTYGTSTILVDGYISILYSASNPIASVNGRPSAE